MKKKFGVGPLLFACITSASVLGASSAANAETSDDRYFNAFEQTVHAQPSATKSHRARKHVRHSRKLRRWAAAARHQEPVRRHAVVQRAEIRADSSELSSLIAAKAAAHGVPVGLATAVVRVESNYKAHVTGRAGEVGLMQIKYQTARGLGYTGTRAALYDPTTNLEWGMRYLAGAHKLAGGNLCGTLAKYQGGHNTRGTRTSHNYCGRVRTAMSARGA